VIAEREAPGLRLDPGYCRRYLTNIIRYDLGPAEVAGMNHFHALAADLGLAPAGGTRVRDHRPDLVQSR
jgi:chorismate dehydratase